MLNCPFDVRPLAGGMFRHSCPNCGRVIVLPAPHVTADCGPRAVVTMEVPETKGPGTVVTMEVPETKGPGTWVHKLLEMIGVSASESCKCGPRRAYLDAMGINWCRQNSSITLGWMREEAESRGMTFVESQARWLVNLAITLAEDQREPSRLERIRLRAMRLGSRLLSRAN